MTTGAVRMAAARQADAASSWLADPQGAALLAGLAGFTLILLLLTQRVRHPLAIPLALAVAILATDGGLYLSGIPFATTRAAGLLFDVAGHSVPTLPLFSGAMVQADWDAILQAAPGFAPVAVLSIVQTLVTAASLEFTLDTEADLDRELRSQGAANVASAMLGGTLGFVSTAYTAASIAAHGRGRVAGVTAGLVMLACLAGGGILIAGIPRFVLGGLLALLGVRLLWDWVVASRRRMPRHEWLLTVAVVAITALAGVLPALLVGLVGSCVLIALSMSRVAVVRREYGIHEGPSSLQRSEEEMRVLAARGGEARVLELGGLAFFGSAYRLYAEVKEMLAGGRVRILVLDFSTVLGIDSSAAAILGRIRSLVRNAGATLIVSGLDAAGARALGGDGGAVALHRTLDEAVEAAEAALLERHAPPPAPRAADWLARALGDGDMARALAAQLSVARYAAGEVLCRQGEAASTMFFIGSGRVCVWVEAPGQPDTRVRVFGANTIAGELGFFLGAPRNATLRVEREAWVGQLGRAEFDALAAAQPGLAVALMEYLARVQAERLSFATRQIVALRR